VPTGWKSKFNGAIIPTDLNEKWVSNPGVAGRTVKLI